jgi:hypothetical protein
MRAKEAAEIVAVSCWSLTRNVADFGEYNLKIVLDEYMPA